MTQTVYNLRLLALIAAIAAGLLLEAKAQDAGLMAKKDCFHLGALI